MPCLFVCRSAKKKFWSRIGEKSSSERKKGVERQNGSSQDPLHSLQRLSLRSQISFLALVTSCSHFWYTSRTYQKGIDSW